MCPGCNLHNLHLLVCHVIYLFALVSLLTCVTSMKRPRYFLFQLITNTTFSEAFISGDIVISMSFVRSLAGLRKEKQSLRDANSGIFKVSH